MERTLKITDVTPLHLFLTARSDKVYFAKIRGHVFGLTVICLDLNYLKDLLA